MRYIADDNGYLLQVSFGAMIECNGRGCVEYTGVVPAGYNDLADWFSQEGDKLHRWHIVKGDLTLDVYAPEPEIYVPPVEPKVGMRLLWENDKPNEAMGANTIPFDLSAYTHIAIEAKWVASADWSTQEWKIFSKNGSGDRVFGFVGADTGVVSRKITAINDHGVTFSGGMTSSGSNNKAAIPVKIYGIKGIVDIIPVEKTAVCGTFLCGEAICGQ